ncbi:glycoside hydrolase family 2 protein [Phytoactinopolyspora halotolerans]|uniref:Glycoside hydrolase family 2 n=1 Tax=Phytoactinopolyspora halotolerans TaxID=1981512 RepID=A0A6L9SFB4_9ACTN|nr:sugar-binding domain-containing protein [Phytoactinopolyspora halotolerans]NEE03827.1 glycoside hydrolase family 2 [Phytoactinopolyspora halotolerans]
MTIDSEYPRPLLVRSAWQDLSGAWGFATDEKDAGRSSGWHHDPTPFTRTITVPYPPESELSGVHDRDCPAVVWYRRDVRLNRAPGPDERLLLHFGAVDYQAHVWFNGVHVGEHEGGHTPFTLDVTDAVVVGEEQVVVVRAEDERDDATQPRGKQDWRDEPHAVWYHRTTGIWQPVWAEVVPALHVRRLHWMPDVPAAAVTLEVELSRRPETAVDVHVVLNLGDEVLTDQTFRATQRDSRWTISVPAARHQLEQARLLWSPETPTLLDARVELLDGGCRVDAVSSYVGMRSVGIKDGRFLLNGQPRFLRMVLAQNYWPDSHLAAPSADALRRDVELAKELGFDGVRIHQKIEDPRFLAWCDRLGMLVWSELPSAYEYAPRTVERLTREWLENVARDRSHPCVVTWVPFNESWGVWHGLDVAEQRHATTALYHLTKALDGTRPVISNDGWEHTESDIWGLHDYAPTGESIRRRYADRDGIARILGDRPPARRTALLGDPVHRGQPVMLTEIGGLSLRPRAEEAWHGYGTVGSVEELAEGFRGLVDAVLDSPELAGFCWTQLTDTEQERNGLLTEDREPKLPAEVVRSIVARPARSVPAEAIDAARRAARAPG